MLHTISQGFCAISPVVLYGRETLSLTLKKEHRLRVFENGVLRKILGPMRDEVTAEWRRQHSEELYDLGSSPNIIRVTKTIRMRWAGHVARMGDRRGAYRILVEKPQEKRALVRPRRRWEDNIKINLQEVEWEGELDRPKDRWRYLLNAVTNVRFHKTRGIS
jgi:hypothetical protein